MEDLIGRVLGNRYEIVEKIGAGGMAVVYKARCRLLNRYVAVKVLRTDTEMTDDFIKRFKVEAQSAGSLSHPNIVSIYDVGNEGNINYIVMEFVEGYTLKEVVAKSDRLTWRASVRIASQICAGLEHAHKNHIIHRDIKSQNILVTSDLMAKVTDFGIARASSNSTITITGNTIGSVHYFSPEQAKGQHTDEKSDIYSLGIVMYEMLVGRVPLDADTPVSVALKQIQEVPIPPAQIDSEIPTSVSDIVMKALQKEPRLRYQTAAEMLKDLNTVLENPNNVVISDSNMGATTVMSSVNENMINDRANKPVVVEDDEDMGRKKKKSGAGTVFLAFLCSLAIAVLAFIGVRSFIGSVLGPVKAEVSMPNLVGKTLAEAQAELEDLNILIKKINYQESDEVKKNTVIIQYPVANITVRENVKIAEITVSLGKTETVVPNVINLSLEEAKEKLDNEELRYSVAEEANSEVPKGYVVRQNPTENYEVSVGSIIELYVSSGPDVKQVSIPKLVGTTESAAKALIKDAGLTYGITTYETDTTKSNGIVLSQSLSHGKLVAEGTVIDIVVNKRENTKPEPDEPTVFTQKIYLNLKNKGVAGKEFTVKIEMSGGGLSGKQTIYEEKHTREDKELLLDVTGNGLAMLEVYIDGKLDSSQQINFK